MYKINMGSEEKDVRQQYSSYEKKKGNLSPKGSRNQFIPDPNMIDHDPKAYIYVTSNTMFQTVNSVMNFYTCRTQIINKDTF